MAKKSGVKKSSSKKVAKTMKRKPVQVKKKIKVKKAAAAAGKSISRKTISKKQPVKKKTATAGKMKGTIVAKKPTKVKTPVKLKEKKIRVALPGKKISKKEEMRQAELISAEKQAEARAKAMQKIKGYSKKDLEHFKQIILAKRDEIVEQLQNLKEQMLDPTTGEYINENSPYSLHMAEQGTDAMEREKTFLYAQRENKFLGYLEDALKRIELGTYGICIDCIEEPQHLCETCPLIPKERLEAVPHSQLCVAMKQRQEKR